MYGKLVQPPTDGLVAALAARQHGVVGRAQLLALGLGEAATDARIRAGRLHRVHRGVYAVGHPRLTREGCFMAAVLAYGKGAVLSHLPAAVLWGLLPERGPRIDVTVPRTSGARRGRRLVIVHRAALPAEDVTTKDGIPVTTPARTILDIADVQPRRQVERALDEGAFLRLDLHGLAPRPGRRGSGTLACVLADHRPGSTRTRSELEEDMLGLCRRHGLPVPEVNRPVEGYTVDFVWAEQRLVVETDGWQAHGTRAAFERDRHRDAVLTAAGWRVARITWARLQGEPGEVAELVARLLTC